MAQLVARLVRNEKVGGSNPPSSTTGRHPIRMSAFCMLGCVVAVLVAVLLVVPLVFGAPAGRVVGPGRCVCRWAAARPRAVRAASLRLGASSRSPARPRRRPRAPQPGPAGTHRHRVQAMPSPTGTAARPSGALHTGGTWCTDGAVRRLEARPGPAAAHGHRSQTLRPLRRSSSWWCLVYSAISHVIPSQLVQTLNSPRWDCNVFGWSRKVTVGNYVRNLFGCVLAAAHRHRGEVLRPLRRASHLWGQECCCVGSLDLCLAFGTKFALLGFLVVRTVHNSPCLASWW